MLLSLAFVAAVVFAMLLPFRPQVSFSKLKETVPDEIFADRYRQFRFTVTNEGILPVWCCDAETPIPSDDWFFDASEGGSSQIHISIYKDQYLRLKSGQSRTYNLQLHRDFDHFHLFLDVRDWRGRTAMVQGELSTVPEED
tara:strand:- start:72 stop:494 length:423 start_codon:yes stop_codon:yes gene_type:complete